MKKINIIIINFFNKNFKIILSILITALLVGCTTAFASYNYFAKDVEYAKNDGAKISVEDALNELYMSNKKPKDIKYYSDADKNNFVSTYTAKENCTVIAIAVSMNSQDRGFQRSSITSDGTLISEKTTCSSEGPATLLVKVYSLVSGQKIDCTSSAYFWGVMSHEFIVF